MLDPNLIDRMTYAHDEMPEGVFSVSDPDSLGNILLHGYVGRELWAVVCDHRSGEAHVGVLSSEVVRSHLEGPSVTTEGAS